MLWQWRCGVDGCCRLRQWLREAVTMAAVAIAVETMDVEAATMMAINLQINIIIKMGKRLIFMIDTAFSCLLLFVNKFN